MIWPIYIDATASRKQGRKISRERAVKNPTADDIVKAAKKLGLNPVKEEKSYPKRWWRREGRVLVDKKERKMSILVKIAENVKQSKLNI